MKCEGKESEMGFYAPACAIAFTPLVAVNPVGSVIVKSTSYITVPGRILGSLRVVLRPSAVSPRIGVISLPAYVVGMQMCGRPVRTLMALPSPIVLLPPIDTTLSAFVSCA